MYKVLISAERSHLDAMANEIRTAELRQVLRASGLWYVPVIGRWEGKEEQAMMVDAPDANYVRTLQGFASMYSQDAILVIDTGSLGAYLLTGPDADHVDLGTWRLATKEESESAQGVTLIGNEVYIAAK